MVGWLLCLESKGTDHGWILPKIFQFLLSFLNSKLVWVIKFDFGKTFGSIKPLILNLNLIQVKKKFLFSIVGQQQPNLEYRHLEASFWQRIEQLGGPHWQVRFGLQWWRGGPNQMVPWRNWKLFNSVCHPTSCWSPKVPITSSIWLAWTLMPYFKENLELGASPCPVVDFAGGRLRL